MATLLPEFISITAASLIPRSQKLNSPRLPDDLKAFMELYQSGHYLWGGDRFDLTADAFGYDLNVYHAIHEAKPANSPLGAFRRYDDCYVLASCSSEPSPQFDPERLFLGVDLNERRFGWIFLYCTGEHYWDLSNNACYIAESWSDYMKLVIEKRYDFHGLPFYSREHRILSDADLGDYYTPELPPGERGQSSNFDKTRH